MGGSARRSADRGDVGELPGAAHHPARGLPVDDLEFQPADPGAPSARTVAMVFVRARVEPAAYPARKLPERSCLLSGYCLACELGGRDWRGGGGFVLGGRGGP